MAMTYEQSFDPVDAGYRHGFPPGGSPTHIPMEAGAMDRLRGWIAGRHALTRAEAHQLLERAVESGQMAQHRAEFLAAIKALAAGPRSWDDMGYRLLPDH